MDNSRLQRYWNEMPEVYSHASPAKQISRNPGIALFLIYGCPNYRSTAWCLSKCCMCMKLCACEIWNSYSAPYAHCWVILPFLQCCLIEPVVVPRRPAVWKWARSWMDGHRKDERSPGSCWLKMAEAALGTRSPLQCDLFGRESLRMRITAATHSAFQPRSVVRCWI